MISSTQENSHLLASAASGTPGLVNDDSLFTTPANMHDISINSMSYVANMRASGVPKQMATDGSRLPQISGRESEYDREPSPFT